MQWRFKNTEKDRPKQEKKRKIILQDLAKKQLKLLKGERNETGKQR
jgi:hypothetical protein